MACAKDTLLQSVVLRRTWLATLSLVDVGLFEFRSMHLITRLDPVPVASRPSSEMVIRHPPQNHYFPHQRLPNNAPQKYHRAHLLRRNRAEGSHLGTLISSDRRCTCASSSPIAKSCRQHHTCLSQAHGRSVLAFSFQHTGAIERRHSDPCASLGETMRLICCSDPGTRARSRDTSGNRQEAFRRERRRADSL
jgi:hypothetical protein